MKKPTTKKPAPIKAKNKRSKSKYPALDPKLNLKTRKHLIDFDYIDKLTEKEKEWLNTFSEEYNNANFNHGKKILHKTKELKKDCYGKNNQRNRCQLTRAKAQDKSIYMDDLTPDEIKEVNAEIYGEEVNDEDTEENS